MEGLGHQKPEEIAIIRKEAGRFILATNLVDDEKLKPEEIITNYKNQQSCERGFRFLKDPLFFTEVFPTTTTISSTYFQIDAAIIGYKTNWFSS